MIKKRLNIVNILTDDQGAWAMRCAGNDEIVTPNLDRLAAEGVRFDNFYCASPVCSPARASLLTGEMPSAHGVHDWLSGGNGSSDRFPDAGFRDRGIEYLEGHPSYIAELAKAGYRCALSGKWHLGNQEDKKEGFEGWYVMFGGGCAYYHPLMFDGAEMKYIPFHGTYVTDLITDRAIGFIDEYAAGDSPFCVEVHYNAPHSPWSHDNHPEEYLRLYRDCPFDSAPNLPLHPRQVTSAPMGDTPEKRRENLIGYYAAVTAMDANAGRIIARLEELGIYDDTVITFTSDNGMNMGHHGLWGKGNATYPPNMYDTSVKVPFIIKAPLIAAPGKVVHMTASHCDIFPTLCGIAGVSFVPGRYQPGVSLLPRLTGERGDGSRGVCVYDEYGFVRMLRKGDYKLVRRYIGDDDELYDMVSDPDETMNLIADPKYAGLVSGMKAELEEWFAKYGTLECDGRNSLTLTGSGQRDLCHKPDAFTDVNRVYNTGEPCRR